MDLSWQHLNAYVPHIDPVVFLLLPITPAIQSRTPTVAVQCRIPLHALRASLNAADISLLVFSTFHCIILARVFLCISVSLFLYLFPPNTPPHFISFYCGFRVRGSLYLYNLLPSL